MIGILSAAQRDGNPQGKSGTVLQCQRRDGRTQPKHRSPTSPQVGFLHLNPVFGSRSEDRSGYFSAIHFSVINLFVNMRFPRFMVSKHPEQ